MPNPTANPLGAGGDVTKAAPLIRAYLDKQEPQGQPAETSAPPQANQPQATEAPSAERPRDPVTKRFVKQEPQATEEAPPEAEAPKEEAKPVEASESDHEELADTIDGLAKQLGMEADELSDHLKATIKVNGEERKANLKELIAGYQMQSDYQRKTAEIAEERRKVSAELTQYQQQREHLSSQLQPLVQQLEAQVGNDQQAIQRAYEQGDFQEAARLQFLAQQRQAQLDTAKQQQQRINEEKSREQRLALEQHVADQERILLEKKPAWKDVEKGKKELTAIREYLKAEGVPAQQADTLYEAVPLLMAEKAMLWDRLQKQQKPDALKQLEVKAVPKFQKPGPAKSAEDPKKTVHRTNLNRLRRSGDVRDAAKALLSGGFVTR